jgi:hypothetical protein
MTGGVCIGACLPDPGWGPPDCRAEDQFDKLPLESFDEFDDTNTGHPVAEDWYTYTDGTATLLFGLGDAGSILDGGFQPPVEFMPVCRPDAGPGTAGVAAGSQPGNRILHVFGGQFLGWGGGMGLAMAKVSGRERSSAPSGGNIDPLSPRSVCLSAPDASICPPSSSEYAIYYGAVDVSQYEGVSFWARRGPNSQAGIHVMVGDKSTDDDLNYLAQRAPFDDAGPGSGPDGGPQPIRCQRIRECDCVSHQACVTYPQGIGDGKQIQGAFLPQFCIQPGAGTQFSSECAGGVGALGSGSQGGGATNCCDRFQCNQWYAPFPNDELLPAVSPYNRSTLFHAGPSGGYGSGGLGDPQFAGRPCTPYQWPNGVGGSYCFDPAIDPPPAPTTEQCGDHWMATATLSTEWHYFTIPFTDLHQQGWAQKSEHLDLTSVSVVRFTWDAGWIDYYIDSLSFYRHKPSGQ